MSQQKNKKGSLMEQFRQLELYRWRQFEHVRIDFDRDLCILTGSNGCGKTTVLNVLARHFGWDVRLVSSLFPGKRRNLRSDVWEEPEKDSETDRAVQIGTIEYASGHRCILTAPPYTGPQYSLQYQDQRHVPGVHIPSHRPVVTYQKTGAIPTDPREILQQSEEFRDLLFHTYSSENVRNPGIVLKQSLVALAVFGYGNEAVAPTYEYCELFERFQEILRMVLPKEIGFRRMEIRMPDIVLITESGDFSLDAMSGGIGDVFGMAWQILMYGSDKADCTVIIDEPENHLHPSMQREFLPSLRRAFPGYKFVVATHSPFIVSSDPHASVYGLIFNDDKRVISERLDNADLSASPNKILRDIMGLPTTLPVWVQEKIEKILEKYSGMDATEENAGKIYGELRELGLSDSVREFVPESGGDCSEKPDEIR
ncbi:AAA family ATPase [Desulfobacterales bacterium HSG2]|nr:AAA family ATPase [Desulfobacterales bacterium HSG2]